MHTIHLPVKPEKVEKQSFQETLYLLSGFTGKFSGKTADWRNFLSVSLFGNLGTPLWTCLYGEMNLRINKQTHVWSCLTCYSCWHPYFQVVFLALLYFHRVQVIWPASPSSHLGIMVVFTYYPPMKHDNWNCLFIDDFQWFSHWKPLWKGFFQPATFDELPKVGTHLDAGQPQLSSRDLSRPSFQMPFKHCLRERRSRVVTKWGRDRCEETTKSTQVHFCVSINVMCPSSIRPGNGSLYSASSWLGRLVTSD